MNGEELSTLQVIQITGRNEFLEKGFREASLRNIVKEAGVTTGAFYGYYKSKAELFDALVEEQFTVFMEKYRECQNTFTQLPPDEQEHKMGEISGECMDWMVEYVYDNFDAFKLLVCCSEGTKYENMIHEMVEIEVEGTDRFVSVLRSMGRKVPDIDRHLEHMIVSGMFSAIFEMIVHDMPRERARIYIKELRTFYTAGWSKIMGL